MFQGFQLRSILWQDDRMLAIFKLSRQKQEVTTTTRSTLTLLFVFVILNYCNIMVV